MLIATLPDWRQSNPLYGFCPALIAAKWGGVDRSYIVGGRESHKPTNQPTNQRSAAPTSCIEVAAVSDVNIAQLIPKNDA
jgi:hypothetical protein